MKTFLIDQVIREKSDDSPLSWYFLADSALSNAGKPFFLPEEEVSVSGGLAFKVCKLGKTIAPKFSFRYVDAVAPVVSFRLMSLFDLLKEQNLTTDPAVSFDKALFYGDFIPLEMLSNEGRELKFSVNGHLIEEIDCKQVYNSLQQIIPLISKYNTLKTGDYIVIKGQKSENISLGDIIETEIGGENRLTVKIK